MSAPGGRRPSRIEQALHDARRARGRGAFVPFLTAGDPDLETTVELALALAEAGADVLEIGLPFSDPLADGPVIQRSTQRALAGGVTPPAVLDAIARLTAATRVPVVLMTYVNPVMQLAGGLAAVARAGVAGVILTDLPFDQEHEAWAAAAAAGLDPILLVTPTTPPARLARIAGQARGFVYCVTRMGVTGSGGMDAAALRERVAALRRVSALPILLGFGIGSGRDARAVGGLADGVVVGSALVERLAEATDRLATARAFAAEMVSGLTNGSPVEGAQDP